MPNYRILVSFDSERSLFVARVPELEHCSADGATRAEAVAKVEEEIAAQVANVKEKGGHVPPALDDGLAQHSGELAVKVSSGLHRDLAWQAKTENVELGALIAEILAAGLEARKARTAQRRAQQPQQQQRARDDDDDRGQRMPPQGQGQPRRGGGRDQRDPRYHQIMEDPASFLEYVRQLEQNGGQPRRGGGGGGGGGRK
jgi:predicted RNase H-like HicB family nuclease